MEETVEIFAAAFCSAEKYVYTRQPVGPCAEAVFAALAALRCGALPLKNGRLRVAPCRFRPAPACVSLSACTGEQFLFFAGLAAAAGLAFGAKTVSPAPAASEIRAALRCADGTLWIEETPAGFSAASVLPAGEFTLSEAVPSAFAKGLLVGAVLALSDTDFIFEDGAPGEGLLACRALLASHGARMADLTEGIRVYTRIGSLEPLPARMRKKRKYKLP